MSILGYLIGALAVSFSLFFVILQKCKRVRHRKLQQRISLVNRTVDRKLSQEQGKRRNPKVYVIEDSQEDRIN